VLVGRHSRKSFDIYVCSCVRGAPKNSQGTNVLTKTPLCGPSDVHESTRRERQARVCCTGRLAGDQRRRLICDDPLQGLSAVHVTPNLARGACSRFANVRYLTTEATWAMVDRRDTLLQSGSPPVSHHNARSAAYSMQRTGACNAQLVRHEGGGCGSVAKRHSDDCAAGAQTRPAGGEGNAVILRRRDSGLSPGGADGFSRIPKEARRWLSTAIAIRGRGPGAAPRGGGLLDSRPEQGCSCSRRNTRRRSTSLRNAWVAYPSHRTRKTP